MKWEESEGRNGVEVNIVDRSCDEVFPVRRNGVVSDSGS